MLGIAPDKEKILNIISTTFGIKDEVPSMSKLPHLDKKKYLIQLMDHQNQIEMKESAIFDFSIFVTSMLTDRSIITFDKILFKRLRVIGLLMNTKPNSREIEKFADDKISNPIFGDDLQSYAVRVSTSNGSFFKLTNEDEFTPFFPVMYRTDRVAILMKYKDKLIPILDYTPLPRGLEMKSCFRNPTFLASMYSLLCSSKETFTQIGLAMFILSIRNGEKFDLESYEFELIDALKQVLDDNPHFNFLTMRIQLGEDKKMSFIEAVQSKQRLGYEAIEKTDLPPVLRPKTAGDDQIQKEKKENAKNLRKKLMEEFQNQRAQFTIGGGTTCTNDFENEMMKIEFGVQCHQEEVSHMKQIIQQAFYVTFVKLVQMMMFLDFHVFHYLVYFLHLLTTSFTTLEFLSTTMKVFIHFQFACIMFISNASWDFTEIKKRRTYLTA